MFSSEQLTDQQIRDYAQSLAGGVPLEERVTNQIWSAQLNDGSKINLRNVSSSSSQTKARWTIELIQNHQIKNTLGKETKRIEIKLR